jgi:hypothetical protein
MPHLVVASEGDLEYSIKYVTAIALAEGSDKFIELTFPSQRLMEIFMSNLFTSFIINKVPQQNNTNITINIPDDEGTVNVDEY